MGISRFFTTSLTVSRESFTSNKATFGNIGTILGHVQQASPEDAIALNMNATTTFNIWCANGSNVEQGDKLTDASSNVYGVKAVQEDNYAGLNKHLRLVCQRINKA